MNKFYTVAPKPSGVLHRLRFARSRSLTYRTVRLRCSRSPALSGRPFRRLATKTYSYSGLADLLDHHSHLFHVAFHFVVDVNIGPRLKITSLDGTRDDAEGDLLLFTLDDQFAQGNGLNRAVDVEDLFLNRRIVFPETTPLQDQQQQAREAQ